MYCPNIVSKNHSVNFLRINREAVQDKEKYPLGKFDFRSLINFGSRSKMCEDIALSVENDKGIILNHPKFIQNASNKILAKELMEKRSVPTPKYIKEVSDRKGLLALKFPVVAKLITGSGGEGLVLLESIEKYDEWVKTLTKTKQREYFVEEVIQPRMSKNYEYRFSVSPWLIAINTYHDDQEVNFDNSPSTAFNNSGCITAMRKFMRSEAVKEGSFGRNISLGNSYFRKVNHLEEKIPVLMGIEVAMNAVIACGLDFGAVDVIYDSETKQWNVLEVNTAPALMREGEEPGYTANRWQTCLRTILNTKHKFTR
jgi:glutathione synthase/RimK-type ligase-like ATP-grasp enzyme